MLLTSIDKTLIHQHWKLQNNLGWKGRLEVIWSSPLLKARHDQGTDPSAGHKNNSLHVGWQKSSAGLKWKCFDIHLCCSLELSMSNLVDLQAKWCFSNSWPCNHIFASEGKPGSPSPSLPITTGLQALVLVWGLIIVPFKSMESLPLVSVGAGSDSHSSETPRGFELYPTHAAFSLRLTGFLVGV